VYYPYIVGIRMFKITFIQFWTDSCGF